MVKLSDRIAKDALKRALATRRQAGISLDVPVNPFDLSEALGIEVRFVDVPSIEGIYIRRDPPLVLVSNSRPPGRQTFTCAHELGHHTYGHSTRADLINLTPNMPRDREETQADIFAGYLLMPKAAVVKGFRARNWSTCRLSAQQAFVVAGWLGVSYTALLTHLSDSLHMLDKTKAASLQRVRLQDIRESFGAGLGNHPLLVIDDAWTPHPVDIRVGDRLLLPVGTGVTTPQLVPVEPRTDGSIVVASAPGAFNVTIPNGSRVPIRVSRLGFTGRSRFRFLEDPEYEPRPSHN